MMKGRTSFASASLSEGGVTEGDGGLWLSDLDNHDFDFTMSLGSVQYLLRGR